MGEPSAAPSQAHDKPGIEIQVPESMTTATDADKVTKVIVAVHGVGEQHSFATIQSVVNQFCILHGQPAAVPLGTFHTKSSALYLSNPPFPAEPFGHLAFAEVYWASIPRKIVDEKYTLEEAKNWASTIVERLRMRWLNEGRATHVEEPDFARLKQVLHEMIETIAVIERLCFVAAKAGLFTFDLRKLLDAYLGDVQVVVEFEDQRNEILAAFRDRMASIHKEFKNADIFVVSHSEGTVVSFLGLLEAGRKPEAAPWIEKVRGFMTFGSPLDKHLILWPSLFGQHPNSRPEQRDPPRFEPEHPIEWRNYYDKGDPIGFALDDVRWWLGEKGWDRVFNFTGGDDGDDIGFIRYPFPGKAHVDYWNDRKVFGHFIGNVVGERPAPKPAKQIKQIKQTKATDQAKSTDQADQAPPAGADDRPRDILWTKVLSYLIPYGGIAALFFVAVYVLFKTVTTYMYGKAADYEVGYIIANVAAVAILLFGVTVTSRIPRLTRLRSLRLFAGLVFVLSAAVFLRVLPEHDPTIWKHFGWDLTIPAGWSRLALAILVVGLVCPISGRWPSLGLKPLLFAGAVGTAGLITYHVLTTVHDKGKLWPVFLGAAGFFYLWWLAALMFDLVFVWHLYIRQALAVRHMDAWVGYRARFESDSTILKIATAERSLKLNVPWPNRGPAPAPGGGASGS